MWGGQGSPPNKAHGGGYVYVSVNVVDFFIVRMFMFRFRMKCHVGCFLMCVEVIVTKKGPGDYWSGWSL